MATEPLAISWAPGGDLWEPEKLLERSVVSDVSDLAFKASVEVCSPLRPAVQTLYYGKPDFRFYSFAALSWNKFFM